MSIVLGVAGDLGYKADMKLIRFGEFRREKPGVLLSSGIRKDCSQHVDDYDHDFFQGGGIERLRALVEALGDALPDVPEGARWGAPIARPGKVLCIGLNYSDHAKETGAEVPSEPVVFQKGSNTVVGPFDDVLIPRKSVKTDWEVELGVVIGKDARYLDSPDEALEHIAGYSISNDVSEREFQIEHCGQWTKGKSCDTFNPLGPFLLTPDEVSDPQNLPMRLEVNGALRQNGNTKTMVYGVRFLVHYLSQFMTLEAGDLLSTGTPPGVGMGMKPQLFLKAGDVMELAIEGLGRQRQICRNA